MRTKLKTKKRHGFETEIDWRSGGANRK